jgi:hypothetical protein
MLLLALLAQGLCLTGRSLPMRTAAAHARLRRSGAPALSDDGLMEAGLEVLDVAGGGETPDGFAALGVSLTRIADNLAAANITTPNSLQSAAFQPLARGRDAIVQAHTGSGKTLAFLLPLLEHLDARSNEPQALIVCPSRELAFQTARVADLLLEGTGATRGSSHAPRPRPVPYWRHWYPASERCRLPIGSPPRPGAVPASAADTCRRQPMPTCPVLFLAARAQACRAWRCRAAPTRTGRWSACARRGRSCWWGRRAACASWRSSGRS